MDPGSVISVPTYIIGKTTRHGVNFVQVKLIALIGAMALDFLIDAFGVDLVAYFEYFLRLVEALP